jgi:heme/copper-type cytochrome/quinol oxidase subunit 4
VKDSLWLNLPLWVFAYSGMKITELIKEFIAIMGVLQMQSEMIKNIYMGSKKKLKWFNGDNT